MYRTAQQKMGENLHPVQFQSTYQGRYGQARVSTEGYISNLEVPEERRGQGHGTAIMEQITGDADKFGHALKLHAEPELHEFYGRHGFVQTGHDYMGGVKRPRLERKPRMKDVKGI